MPRLRSARVSGPQRPDWYSQQGEGLPSPSMLPALSPNSTSQPICGRHLQGSSETSDPHRARNRGFPGQLQCRLRAHRCSSGSPRVRSGPPPGLVLPRPDVPLPPQGLSPSLSAWIRGLCSLTSDIHRVPALQPSPRQASQILLPGPGPFSGQVASSRHHHLRTFYGDRLFQDPRDSS